MDCLRLEQIQPRIKHQQGAYKFQVKLLPKFKAKSQNMNY